MAYSDSMKFILGVGLVLVLLALASAGLFMLKRRPSEDEAAGSVDSRMAWALALRVGLSVALFLLVLLAWHFGWIHPTGVPMGR